MAKEYNIKAIIDNDDLRLLFDCDKEKNKQCNKKYCGTCNHTTDARYMKAKARQHNKDISDKELICSLESEIEYYRYELDLIKKVHKEDKECINKQDKLIKEYQKTFKDIVINNEDILRVKTLSQIRKLLGYDEVDNKDRDNSKVLNKQFEITINNEKYLIKHNSNIEINLIELNAYLTKLVNEKDKISILKDNQFRIINITRGKANNIFVEE